VIEAQGKFFSGWLVSFEEGLVRPSTHIKDVKGLEVLTPTIMKHFIS
jgi:hypothetical protein